MLSDEATCKRLSNFNTACAIFSKEVIRELPKGTNWKFLHRYNYEYITYYVLCVRVRISWKQQSFSALRSFQDKCSSSRLKSNETKNKSRYYFRPWRRVTNPWFFFSTQVEKKWCVWSQNATIRRPPKRILKINFRNVTSRLTYTRTLYKCIKSNETD